MNDTYLIVIREDGTPMTAICDGRLVVPLFLNADDAIEQADEQADRSRSGYGSSWLSGIGKYKLKPVKMQLQ